MRTSVALSLFTDFVNLLEYHPGSHQVEALETRIDEIIAWSRALAPLRATAAPT